MRAGKVSALLLTVGLAFAAIPAEAVVILDSTWAKEGGEIDDAGPQPVLYAGGS